MNDELSFTNIMVIWTSERGYTATKDGRVISPGGKEKSLWRNTSGYDTFSVTIVKDLDRFRKNKDAKSNVWAVGVHKLVAYQKFGDAMFLDGIQVRHLDGDKTNNAIDNISIGTQSENRLDMSPEVRMRTAIDAGRANSTLTDDDVVSIREQFDEGATLQAVMNKYGIAKSTASYIKNRVTYKYL